MAVWKPKKLGDVLRLEYGKPLAPGDRNPEGAFPVYGANGEKDRSDRFYQSEPGIVIGRKGSAGEITLTEEKYWPLDVTYFVGFDRDHYDLRFLYYLLKTLNLSALAKGVKPGINRNEVHELPVMVPTLPEQRRIVAMIDAAFEGIAIAKANAEKGLQNVRDLSGMLSDSCLDGCADDGFLPHRLEDLCELIVDCEHKTAPTQEDGFPSIRTANIGKGRLILDNVNRVSVETYAAWTRRAVPMPGDLILAREAPAGNVAVIPKGLKVCLGQRTVLIRPRRDLFEPEYLAYFLLKSSSQRRLLAHSRGATVQHINVKDIRSFEVSSIPSLEVQRRVVRRIKEVEGACEVLRDLRRRKIDAIEKLKKSLLHQAFTGQI